MNPVLQYVLDTDTSIHLLNGVPRVESRLDQVGVDSVSIAIPTLGELYYGAYSSERVEANLARLRAFLADPGPQVLPIDPAAVECFGRLKARLRRTGQPIGDIDLLIAGVAVSRGLTLVTNNTRHFARIPDISLENWLVG
jgi:tRNA(fMet)-specific endonuclease VapC